MKISILKRIAIAVCAFICIVIAGVLLFRGTLLRYMADGRLDAIGHKYGLQITYSDLSMPSLSKISIEDLSVVPYQRDTLLYIGKAEIILDVLPLLSGKISVKEVNTDSTKVTFSKQAARSNYDFLFRARSEREVVGEKADNRPAGYDERIGKALHLCFRLLPENGKMNNLHIVACRDSLYTSFRIPSLSVDEGNFLAVASVAEGDMTGRWKLQGILGSNMHLLEVGIASDEAGKKVILPYIRPHYGAVLEFDSIAFKLLENRTAPDSLVLEGTASVDGLEVYHKALSLDTINLDRGRLDYKCRIGDDYLELDSASRVVFNHLDFHPYFRARKENRWHFTASIHRPDFPSQNLFLSLPKGLFGHIQDIRTSGTLSYNLLLDVDFNNLDSLRFSSDLLGHGFRIESLGESELTKMNEEFEYTAYENDYPVRTFFIGPSNPSFRPLDRISPLLQMAIMQSEDGGFYHHQGFLPGAIQEALAYDLKVGRFARGGSTITMQLVKNVFLNRHKNIARKLEEALIVWLIESQHLTSKERMYEVYLNLVEWGPLVYGACEASRFYFEKEPDDLTVEEAIFLASIVPKPKHFRSVFNEDATLRENQEGYFRLIAERLCAKGLLTEEAAASIRPHITVKGKARELILYSDSIQ